VILLVQSGACGSQAEAEAWLRCARHAESARQKFQALHEWWRLGIDPAVGWRWERGGFHASEGLLPARHGWTPQQYRALLILESIDWVNRQDDRLPYRTLTDAWVLSGIPADRALLYREARYPLPVALDLEARRTTDPSVDATVAALAALRRRAPGPRASTQP
jgi:hypothetical protein